MSESPSTTIAEKVNVNPQLDNTITSPVQREKLDNTFKTFFDEEDKKEAERAVEPPKVEDASLEKIPDQEEHKEEPKTPSAPAAPSAPVEAKTEVKDEPIPLSTAAPKETDIDSLELHPGASEKQKSDFKKVKEIAKTFATEAKIYRSKLSPIVRELMGVELKEDPMEMGQILDQFHEQVKTWKNGAMAPEVQTELNTLRELARSVGVLQSEEFTRDYVKPVDTAYIKVLDEMAKYFDAPEDKIKAEFLDPLKAKYKPHQLPPEWWDQQLDLMTKAPVSVRRKIELQVADVMRLQEKHDEKAKELAENKQSYADWQSKSREQYAKDYDRMVRDEVEKAFATDKKDIANWRPMASDGITDPEQIRAIQAHNNRFKDLENRFSGVIMGFNEGPRKAARLALEYVEMQETLKGLRDAVSGKESELSALKTSSESALTDLKEENEKLKEEVTKKRKVADVPLRSGQPGKPPPTKTVLPKDSRGSLSKAFEEWKL